MKKALLFYGGWDGHQPAEISARFEKLLQKNGFETDRFEGTECLNDGEKLMEYDLIVPNVTMGTLTGEQSHNVSRAVAHGTGLAGCHGGMCDSFRDNTEWQFMTGGQWVAHPGGDSVRYAVSFRPGSSPITEGLEDFEVCSEQYYLHVDPAVEILATTRFPAVNHYHAANKPIDMPVAWTKFWGIGRVFYCSLGHNDAFFDAYPTASVLMERGMLWAAGGKGSAEKNGISPDRYE